MTYKPVHITASDVLPQDVYGEFGDQALEFFDPYILEGNDLVCDHLGATCVINTWLKQPAGFPRFENRGYRTRSCKEGSKNSAHKEGKALDVDYFKGGVRLDPEMVRREILSHPEKFFPFIRRLERGVNWVHMDCVDTGIDHIIEFDIPKLKAVSK